MADCAVLIPVLNRPHRAEPVARSILETSDARVQFICSPGDVAQHEAVRAIAGVNGALAPFEVGPGDYARKMNYGMTISDEPLIFLGADDLKFHPGWLEQAKRRVRPRIGVIGTNDMGSRRVIMGQHSTHSLIVREYVEKFGTIDEPGKMLHEGYGHNFVDDELVQTAKKRRAWAFAASSKVEHLHPSWKKGETDATYKLGLERFEEDRAHYNSRRHLWTGQRR